MKIANEPIQKSILVKIVKALNYICAILIITNVILRFLNFTNSSDHFFFLLTFYLIGFATLLVISEIGIKKVLVYIEFLSGRIGKGMYIIFIGLMMFDNVLKNDMIIGIVVFLIGVINIIVGCIREEKKEL